MAIETLKDKFLVGNVNLPDAYYNEHLRCDYCNEKLWYKRITYSGMADTSTNFYLNHNPLKCSKNKMNMPIYKYFYDLRNNLKSRFRKIFQGFTIGLPNFNNYD